MNDKFFLLPEEKQQAIINAGFQVFSRNSYRKSPMSEIADAAGISKPLLFHYFHNKLGLYLFLWEEAAQTTLDCLNRYGCYEKTDLFDMMSAGMQAKIRIMKKYPDMTGFVMKAFYEKEPEIHQAIQESYQTHFHRKAYRALQKLDPEQFLPGLDLKLMYREMYWASEGYLWEALQRGPLDVDQIEKDFNELIAFWKQIYLRKREG